MNANLPSLSYRTTVKQEIFSQSLSLDLCVLENLNETIDAIFSFLTESGNESLLEELCPYFGVIWPSARALTEVILEEWELTPPEKQKHIRVLELGCGLAIPSLALSKLGATVQATDFHPAVPEFLATNVRLNQIGHLAFNRLDLRQGLSELEQLFPDRNREKNDINSSPLWVIGSDILYERHHPGELVRTLAYLLGENDHAWIADPARPYLQSFVTECEHFGLHCHTRIIQAEDHPVPKEIFVLHLSRTKR